MPGEEVDRSANAHDHTEVIRLLEDNWDPDVFDHILGRPLVGPLSSRQGLLHPMDDEIDHYDTFCSIIDSLKQLCGSNAAAAYWLAHADPFIDGKRVKDSPLNCLTHGQFWALAILDDVLKVLRDAEEANPGVSVKSAMGFDSTAEGGARFLECRLKLDELEASMNEDPTS